MRLVFSFILLTATPLLALAQSNARTPMVVVGNTAAPATTANTQAPGVFPAAAITNIGEVVGGEKTQTPATPTSPTPPANAADALAPTNPQNPAPPASPANPVSKLWPRDTVPIFMTACVGFHPQKIPPCTCVITQLMMTMGHDQFLAKSENGTIEQDERLQRIRMDCATAPTKKD